MDREIIERNTKVAIAITEKMKECRKDIRKTEEQLQSLESERKLTITYLKATIRRLFESIDEVNKDITRYSYTYVVHESAMTKKEKLIWDDFFNVKKLYDKEVSEFNEFVERYMYFEPSNSDELKKQARMLLEKKGFVVDSPFEGDFEKWIGVYARPKDKPTYLDPADGEEVALQELYSIDGFKQDFAEWFEFELVDGRVVDMK